MCGIGGRTVAEAQQVMSYSEFLDWVAFRNRRGSLHVGMRLERGVAKLLAQQASLHRGRNSPLPRVADFMDYSDETVETLEHAMETWR